MPKTHHFLWLRKEACHDSLFRSCLARLLLFSTVLTTAGDAQSHTNKKLPLTPALVTGSPNRPMYLAYAVVHGIKKSLPVQYTGGRQFVVGRQRSSHRASLIGCVLFKPRALRSPADWWPAAFQPRSAKSENVYLQYVQCVRVRTRVSIPTQKCKHE